MPLKELNRLNLSHNNLSGLLHFISGPANLFRKGLKTLVLINVDQDYDEDSWMQDWLIESLSKLPSLNSLDISQNNILRVDELLCAIQTSPIERLETLSASSCSASERPEPI